MGGAAFWRGDDTANDSRNRVPTAGAVTTLHTAAFTLAITVSQKPYMKNAPVLKILSLMERSRLFAINLLAIIERRSYFTNESMKLKTTN